MGVWCGVIFILSVMRVFGGVPLWVEHWYITGHHGDGSNTY